VTYCVSCVKRLVGWTVPVVRIATGSNAVSIFRAGVSE
jgi:hypothetical protein